MDLIISASAVLPISLFEFLLQSVEGGDHAQSAALALRLEREQIGARVLGIDFALQKTLWPQATRRSG